MNHLKVIDEDVHPTRQTRLGRIDELTFLAQKPMSYVWRKIVAHLLTSVTPFPKSSVNTDQFDDRVSPLLV